MPWNWLAAVAIARIPVEPVTGSARTGGFGRFARETTSRTLSKLKEKGQLVTGMECFCKPLEKRLVVSSSQIHDHPASPWGLASFDADVMRVALQAQALAKRHLNQFAKYFQVAALAATVGSARRALPISRPANNMARWDRFLHATQQPCLSLEGQPSVESCSC